MWDHLPLGALHNCCDKPRLHVAPITGGRFMVFVGIRTTHGWMALGNELTQQWSVN